MEKAREDKLRKCLLWGQAVVYLVEALYYKAEDRGFDYR
jgi:hypothetical protein